MSESQHTNLKPLRLQGVLKRYGWGSSAADSLVAKISAASEGPFAEWWLGAHLSGPAMLESGTSLAKLLGEGSEKILGSRVAEKFGGQLPFLFKVLSIGAPLSIQLHPDRDLATRLNQRDPKNYPDTNHKPEIAIAISELEYLYGFRPQSELRQFVRSIPELSALVSSRSKMLLDSQAIAAARRALLQDLLTARPAEVARSVRELSARLQSEAVSGEERWAKKLCELYPEGDVGVFFVFVLNLCRLAPGEALFTLPGVPHAYLSGELVECMATSDNVVRAALTPKFRDVPVLLEAADYEVELPAQVAVLGEGQGSSYQTPAAEFVVGKFSGGRDFVADDAGGPILFFVMNGEADLSADGVSEQFGPYQSFLVPAGFGKFSLSAGAGTIYWVQVP